MCNTVTVSESGIVQAGLRIEFEARDRQTTAARLVGAARARCPFEGHPQKGDRIAVANIVGVTPATAVAVLPLFLTVGLVEHFTEGPGDGAPERWAVARVSAPADLECCEAIVRALGERGWKLDALLMADHPWVDAVHAWIEQQKD